MNIGKVSARVAVLGARGYSIGSSTIVDPKPTSLTIASLQVWDFLSMED